MFIFLLLIVCVRAVISSSKIYLIGYYFLAQSQKIAIFRISDKLCFWKSWKSSVLKSSSPHRAHCIWSATKNCGSQIKILKGKSQLLMRYSKKDYIFFVSTSKAIKWTVFHHFITINKGFEFLKTNKNLTKEIAIFQFLDFSVSRPKAVLLEALKKQLVKVLIIKSSTPCFICRKKNCFHSTTSYKTK